MSEQQTELKQVLLGWHPYVLVQLMPGATPADDPTLSVLWGGGITEGEAGDFLIDAGEVLAEQQRAASGGPS